MMQILEAGGMKVLTDGLRETDEDNPRGYYEYEKVRSIRMDSTWMPEARGSALKDNDPELLKWRSTFLRKLNRKQLFLSGMKYMKASTNHCVSSDMGSRRS